MKVLTRYLFAHHSYLINFKLILPLALFCMTYGAKGQDVATSTEYERLKRNIFYGTVGFAGLYGAVGGNFERIIVEKDKGFFKNYLLRVGGGAWAEWGGDGSFVVTGLSGLTGVLNHHLEIHLGLAYRSYYDSVVPAGGLGYRFQKPGGHFVFRAGASFPESIYVSLGFCF